VSNFIDELRRRNVFRVAGVYAVVGWILAQISTTLEESLGLPAWFDAVIVAVLLLGLPIALIFAWAFELTPEGVVRSEAVPADESITTQTGRRLDYAIMAGLVLLGAFLTWQQVREPAAVADSMTASERADAAASETTVLRNSIAVLPFDDLSPEGDQEYFSDGIAEEILNVLVGVEGLRVTSRTSSFQFKGRDLGIPAIANELKVRHVVEGSVRKAGNNIRVTAQLIDAENDEHLWSDRFDRPLSAENIFVIQDEIAKAIVVALGETMGLTPDVEVQVTPLTDNLNAYELYLQARTLFQARLELDVVDTLLAQVVELDPGFAKAWEMRAAMPSLLLDYDYTDTSVEEIERLTDEYANRALELDPTRAMALASMSLARLNAVERGRTTNDIRKIIADLNRALDIDPSNTAALNWRGLAYAVVGDLESADRNFLSCITADPYYVACVENHIAVLSAQGKDEEAFDYYLYALGKGVMKLVYAPFAALARLGEEVAFKSAANHPDLLLGWHHHDELYDAFRNLDMDHSALVESMLSFRPAGVNSSSRLTDQFAVPLGAMGIHPIPLLLWDEAHSNYRQTERFRRWVISNSVPEYWREQGFPPQCRPVGNDDFECD